MYECSQMQWVVSLRVSLATILVLPLPAYSSEGQVEISVWNFLPTTWRKKPCNCSEWPDRTERKTAFHPLPCQMAGYNLPHFVALSCCLFIAKISSLWWIMSVNILRSLFSIHCIAVQLPLVLTQMSHHLSWTILLLKSFDMPSMFSPTVSKQLIFFFVSSLTSFRKEKELPKYNLWPCPSVFSLVLSLWCEVLSCAVSCVVMCCLSFSK